MGRSIARDDVSAVRTKGIRPQSIKDSWEETKISVSRLTGVISSLLLNGRLETMRSGMTQEGKPRKGPQRH